MNTGKVTAVGFVIVLGAAFVLGAFCGCAPEPVPDVCADGACVAQVKTGTTPAVPVSDESLAWPMTLAQAQASGVTQLVAVVWNPGCGWCRRAMAVFNDPAVCSGLTVDRGFALANVKAQSADGQRVLARVRVLEFPAVVVMRRKAGAWEVVGAKAYRPNGASVEGFLAFVDALGR